MQVGFLYEQAVELSPRAARIAATLLVQEPALPAPLRRSLAIALAALARGGGEGAGRRPDEGIEPVAPWVAAASTRSQVNFAIWRIR